MNFLNKKTDDIVEADLNILIENRVPEGKHIEYKRDLPDRTDKGKKEFLADVSSFANTNGGDLIFGIEEDNETHEPINLIGLEIDDIDEEKGRLDNLIRTSIEPRLINLTIHPVPLGDSKYAIVIRVPKSRISPHRVIIKGHAKFYARNSTGKYDMDVSELRVAFNMSDTLTEKVRGFREDRISKILADDTPVPLCPNPKTVLHLIPLDAFQPAQQYDIDTVYVNLTKLPLIHYSNYSRRYNLDGIVSYSQETEGKYHSYTQLYRNGIIEAVNTSIIRPHTTNAGTEKHIPSPFYEDRLIGYIRSSIALMSEMMIEPPIVIFLSLLNVKGFRVSHEDNAFFDDPSRHYIDRDNLLLPEIIIDNYDVDVPATLKPIFDLIWNACGEARSRNFNEEGNWAPPRQL